MTRRDITEATWSDAKDDTIQYSPLSLRQCFARPLAKTDLLHQLETLTIGIVGGMHAMLTRIIINWIPGSWNVSIHSYAANITVPMLCKGVLTF